MGLAAIVGSLLFVGFQLKQDQRIALAEIGQSSIESQIEIDALIIENSEIWIKSNAGKELNDTEILIIKRIIYSLYNKRRTETVMRRSLGQDAVVPSRLFASFLIENPGAYRIWLSMSEEEAERMSQFDDARTVQRSRAEFIKALNDMKGPEH